jgi:chromosome segregation ATPase
MKNHLESRLKDLREQFETGQTAMTELNRKQDELRATMLRISGAIQVLEELLGAEPAAQAAEAPQQG